MTKCARQHGEHYPVSAGIPGRESGVTTQLFYSGVNVVRPGMKPRTLDTTTVSDRNGIEKTFLNDVRPRVQAFIRAKGGWKNPAKFLDWNPQTFRFEATIVEDVLYNLEDFSLNDGFNAGSNKIWVVVKTVDSSITMFPQTLVFQLTDGQATRYKNGDTIPVDGKPYSISFKGVKPSPIQYINAPKKNDPPTDPNQPALFEYF